MTAAESVTVKKYAFNVNEIENIRSNDFARNNWPLVYVLSDGANRLAYVGETTDALTRLGTHLKHIDKSNLTAVHLIGSEKFNKSATLDVESKLIRYMAADGQFSLMNGNLGLVAHNYYQREELYSPIFTTIWNRLRSVGLVKHSVAHLDNSDLFKYSPYKSLSFDQRKGLLAILNGLLCKKTTNLVVQGGAGTGKSILAIFLFKLLLSDNSDINIKEFSEDEEALCHMVENLKQRYTDPKLALVIPMASFRKTIKKAFANIAGLNSKMVIGPAELAKGHYDIILVDESHRLRKRANLGAYFGTFDKVSAALGVDKTQCSELDWVLKQSEKAVFFYDKGQSIKPSDVNEIDFDALKRVDSTAVQCLTSQFRVKGGEAYVDFVDGIFNQTLHTAKQFSSKHYEFKLFSSLSNMVEKIKEKDEEFGLARMIAGFAWPWISKKDRNAYDIEINDVQLQWNQTSTDWINTKDAVEEVGCIHTTQGYDLNYAGIILGNEITYDKALKEIVIREDNYFDKNGKQTIKDPLILKQYILNIYKTIMLRGIRGTYLYVCDDNLREYIAQHVPLFNADSARVIPLNKNQQDKVVQPYINAVPFFNIQVAAGDFSQQQQAEQKEWLQIPDGTSINDSFFACTVVGESMNKVIPNGAVCLFQQAPGGSRNGKIVLVEHLDFADPESGSHYTVKEYSSTKIEDKSGWAHEQIELKPASYDDRFNSILLSDEGQPSYRVVGMFICVLEKD